MYQPKITMYKIGAFALSWDEDSTTLKGEPTVVTRTSYTGNLLDTARRTDADFFDVVSDAHERVTMSKLKEMAFEKTGIKHYSGDSWVGQVLIETKKGEFLWRDDAWSHHDGMAIWLFCSLLPKDTPMSISEAEEAIESAVTKFESLAV